ncbi:hypothetical protein ACWDNT_24900, partial [Streptomyces sp. NPDC000963]
MGHDARERVLAHLATCARCKAEADAQRTLKSVFASAAPPPPSEGFLARLQGLPGGPGEPSGDPGGLGGPGGLRGSGGPKSPFEELLGTRGVKSDTTVSWSYDGQGHRRHRPGHPGGRAVPVAAARPRLRQGPH